MAYLLSYSLNHFWALYFYLLLHNQSPPTEWLKQQWSFHLSTKMQSEQDSAGQHVTASTQGHWAAPPGLDHPLLRRLPPMVLSQGILMARWLGFENQCPERRASLVAQTVKSLPAMRETWVRPRVGKIPWRRAWQPTPVFLPAESHRQRSLAGYSPRGRKESDTTEQLGRAQPWGTGSRSR